MRQFRLKFFKRHFKLSPRTSSTKNVVLDIVNVPYVHSSTFVLNPTVHILSILDILFEQWDENSTYFAAHHKAASSKSLQGFWFFAIYRVIKTVLPLLWSLQSIQSLYLQQILSFELQQFISNYLKHFWSNYTNLTFGE